MEVIVMIAQVLLSLSFLVALHELGHLLSAKAFGMRVEKYSIGFPPKIFGVKYGETEYSFGAIPLGGFVKIAGMIDESLDTNQMNSEPQPWEYRSKPAWQRLIVMMGGIIVNIITGIIIFICIKYAIGEVYFSADDVNKHGIYAGKIAEDIGLKTGDKIVKLNGLDYDSFSDVTDPNFFLDNGSYYTVKRGNSTIEVTIPGDLIERLSDEESSGQFISPLQPFTVEEITIGSEAERVGLKAGDKIVALNGNSTPYFQQLRKALIEESGNEIQLTVLRNNEEETLTAQVSPEGTLGFRVNIDLKPSTYNYSIAEAIPVGTVEAFQVITVQLKAFGKIFQGDVNPSKSLSGPIGIARIFGGTWNWLKFWTITGMLSMILAFMNFLPIPALDGGHVVFLLYEMVSGRPPSEKFLENAQKFGMVVLLCLMVFAFGNDIFKLF